MFDREGMADSARRANVASAVHEHASSRLYRVLPGRNVGKCLIALGGRARASTAIAVQIYARDATVASSMADPPIGSVYGTLTVVMASWREYGGRRIGTICKCTRPYIAAFSGLMRGKITRCGACNSAMSLAALQARGLRRPTQY